jgi:hypothetical protein
MAFTPISLNTQQLLESTFIADMRLIINANNTVVQGKLEDLINTLEIDLTNKVIGVDNYLNSVKSNNLVLGNSITFMDSTNTIGSLTKANGKSILSIDQLVIQPGGQIDMTGTNNSMAIKRLGVGIPLSAVTADGFYVGSSSVSVSSAFYGPVNFAKQAITQSTEGSTNTVIATALTGTSYHGELKLNKASKQFIYLTINAPAGQTPANTNQVYIVVYEDPNSIPDPGQTFTIMVRDYQTSTGTDIAVADWGNINIIPGFDKSAVTTRTPAVINGGSLLTSNTISNAITELGSSSVQYIRLYNETISTSAGTNALGGTAKRRFGASVSLTKYENGGSGSTSFARFVVTNSHNTKIIN